MLDAHDPAVRRSRPVKEDGRRREAEGQAIRCAPNKIDPVPRENAHVWPAWSTSVLRPQRCPPAPQAHLWHCSSTLFHRLIVYKQSGGADGRTISVGMRIHSELPVVPKVNSMGLGEKKLLTEQYSNVSKM